MKITIGTDSIIRKKSKLNADVTMKEDHDSTSNLSSNETNSINQHNIASNHSTSKSPSSKFPFSVYWKLDESKIKNKTYKNNPNNEKE